MGLCKLSERQARATISMTSSDNSQKATPVQHRSRETRERLLNFGQKAFAELGHDGVNLARDVLEPSEVSVGSFYYQFADKTDLLIEVLKNDGVHRRAVVVKSLEAMHVEDMSQEEAIRVGMGFFLNSLDDKAYGWELLFRERNNSDARVRQVFLDGREEWIESFVILLTQRSDRPRKRLREAAELVVALALGLAMNHLDLPPETRAKSKKRTLEAAVAFANAGLTQLLDPPVNE